MNLQIYAVYLFIALAFCSCSPSGDYDKIVALRDRIEADPFDVQSLARLIGYLNDDHRLNSGNAAGCLKQLAEGPENKKRIVPVIGPLVVHALILNAEFIGRESTNALSEYGELVLPYKKNLVSILNKHPDEDMAWFAVKSLGNLGPKALDALPDIEALPRYETWSHIRKDAIAKIKAQQDAAANP